MSRETFTLEQLLRTLNSNPNLKNITFQHLNPRPQPLTPPPQVRTPEPITYLLTPTTEILYPTPATLSPNLYHA